MAKIGRKHGRSKATELSAGGTAKDGGGASLAPTLSDGQPRRDKLPAARQSRPGNRPIYVPVVAADGRALMPCHPARARQLVRAGRAKRRFKAGIFYIQLTGEPSARDLQIVTVGIDPGSKREAFTVMSAKRTYLNVLSDAVTWVRKRAEQRRNARRARRYRKTPCRANRQNRARGCLPPSTKARWQAKLRIVDILRKLYPVSTYVVEDVKVASRSQRKWDASFSPLQVGKHWFYRQLQEKGQLYTYAGYETKLMRDELGLKKLKSKMSESFYAHNVDSWVLANVQSGCRFAVDDTRLTRMVPIQLHRRQLHRLQTAHGSRRSRYGGTMSLGFKRGALVRHIKLGLCYVGGTDSMKNVSLHSTANSRRLTTTAKVPECKVLSRFNRWRCNRDAV